jgi:hypothetical protein
MKKVFTVLAVAAFAATNTFATVHQVDNNANSPGVFTTIEAAHDAATAGDTLYIHGSPTTYVTTDIEKQLTIIGEGALPDKNFTWRTNISGLNFKFNSLNTASASGSKLYGCKISSLTIGRNSTFTVAVNNITIQRNLITSAIYFEGSSSNGAAGAHGGILISNNVIGGIQSGVIYNSIIRNNIINYIYSVGDETIGSFTISNNIILQYVGSCNSAAISNNIFFSSDATPLGSASSSANEYCSISNNCILSTAGTLTNALVIYGTNNGGNNLINTDPMFVNPVTDLTSYSPTSPASGPYADFTLANGSPCIGTGSDNLDMGIYGGAVPFFEGTPTNSRYRYFPMPWVPAVLDMNITNSTVLPNGTLEVDFISRKQD